MVRMVIGKNLETLTFKDAARRAYSACTAGWECIIVSTQGETTYYLFEAET